MNVTRHACITMASLVNKDRYNTGIIIKKSQMHTDKDMHMPMQYNS